MSKNTQPIYKNGSTDPTANVKDILREAVNGIRDLREAESRRIDDALDAERHRVNEIMTLRAEYDRILEEKEANRLDSIRQVDVLNQAAAAKSALDAIQALATTTTINADNIRNALNTTAQQMAKQTTDLASTIAAQSAATTEGITVRIAALEKSAAEGIGKGRVTDPIMSQLLDEVKLLRTSDSTTQGKSTGMGNAWGWIIGIAGVLIAAFSVISRL